MRRFAYLFAGDDGPDSSMPTVGPNWLFLRMLPLEALCMGRKREGDGLRRPEEARGRHQGSTLIAQVGAVTMVVGAFFVVAPG